MRCIVNDNLNFFHVRFWLEMVDFMIVVSEFQVSRSRLMNSMLGLSFIQVFPKNFMTANHKAHLQVP